MPVINIYVTEEIYVKLIHMDYPNAQKSAQHIIRKYFKMDEGVKVKP